MSARPLKAVLVNDTSNNSHVGCFATMDTFHRFLSAYGYEIIQVFYNRDLRVTLDEASSYVDDVIRACDVVILNAEGSLHSGRSYELTEIMTRAREAGKPYFVLNAFIAGDETVYPFLADAEAISVRDAESARLLKAHSIDARDCLDAAVLARFDAPRNAARQDAVCVTDWHGEAPGSTLQAVRNLLHSDGASFLPMLRPDAARAWRSIGDLLASHPVVATARYHGAIFAALRGTPFIVLESNSAKMARLALEFGIDDLRLANMNAPITPEYLRQLGADNRHRFRELSDRLWGAVESADKNPLAVLRKQMPVASPPATSVDHLSAAITEIERKFPSNAASRVAAILHLLTIAQSLKSVPPASIARIKNLPFKHADVRVAADIKRDVSAYAMNVLLCDLLVHFDDFGTLTELLETRRRDRERNNDTVGYLEFVLFYNMRKHGAVTYAMGLAEKASRANTRYAGRASAYLASEWPKLRRPSIAAEYIMKRGQSEWTVNENRILWQGGHLDEAINRTRAFLQARPDDVNAQILYGELSFVASRFDDAWQYLHCGSTLYSTGKAALPSRDEVEALLASSDPLTIVFDDQYGVGVAALTMSVLADVVRSGRQVTVQADPRLEPFFDRAFGMSSISFVPLGAETGQSSRKISMMSLGLALRRNRSDFPGTPLIASSTCHQSSRRPRIGLTWSTPNAYSAWYRNIPEAVLVELAIRLHEFADVVSLEIDPAIANGTLARLGLTDIVEVPSNLEPRQDIASHLDLMQTLDAAVGIDCSSSMFAAAVGKPTLVFKSTPHSWLWPVGEPTSIFFSNERFIDRPVVDEWEGQVDMMLDQVRAAIERVPTARA